MMGVEHEFENGLVGRNDGDTNSKRDELEKAEESRERSLDDLLQQCRQVLQELDDFKSHLASCKKDKTVELRHFRNTVNSELKLLEKLTQIDPEIAALRSQHAIRSSNVPFYAAVWAAAKRFGGVVAFNKRFYWEEPPRRGHLPDLSQSHSEATDSALASSRNDEADLVDHATNTPRKSHRSKRKSALVDVVARGGEEWIKVSTITPTRLGFEMAKIGWEADSDSSSLSNSNDGSDDDDDDVSLQKVTARLVRAAKSVRVRYRHPNVVLVLPKIQQHQHAAIDTLLDDLRRTGATVQTADTLPSSSFSSYKDTYSQSPASSSPSLSPESSSPFTPLSPSTLDSLTVNPIASFTSTVNIDCTLLLALVSDLSHGDVAPQPWFHTAIKRQIERERNDTLLPSVLFPAMRGRNLVCVAQAAERMREIVATIGTPTERARTRLLLGDDFEEGDAACLPSSNHTDATESSQTEASCPSFPSLSSHHVPADIHLPITIIPQDNVDKAILQNLPPALSASLAKDLSDINTAVFMYGWASGLTTLSSNRTVAKQIQVAVEQYLDMQEQEHEPGQLMDAEWDKEDTDTKVDTNKDKSGVHTKKTKDDEKGTCIQPGPDIWLCPTARSLVGKEKNRRE